MAKNSLIDDLQSNHLHALWTGLGPEVSDQPRAAETAFHWSWSSLQSVADRAAIEVSVDDADRRVLILANPAFDRTPATTGTLIAAIQVLNPGEVAEPHRHSIAAIRIITDHDGGFTTVNQSKCPMTRGDLILTPAWCWHGHMNDTNSRMLWIDVLDVPLIANLDGIFFEHPDDHSPKIEDATDYSDAAWKDNEIVQTELQQDGAYSPKLRYPWVDIKPTIDAMPPREDGTREIRYINPLNGGAVMPTMDCYATRLDPEQFTRQKRSTASTICYVVEGAGRSEIGDKVISWSSNDIFTVPHWQWTRHRAVGGVAYLVQVTNRDLLHKLGLLRDEDN